MYLVLRPPWGRHVATVPSDGPAVVMIGNDAGVAKAKKKKRRPAGGGLAPLQKEGDGDVEETEPPPLTAADRAMEWRGDETSLPAQKIDMAGGAEARPLDDSEINNTINSDSGIKDCVAQAATNTDLRATITVKMVVDGHGRVTKTKIQAPHYLFEHGLSGCAQRAASHLHFPATGAPTLVTLPVNLG